MVCTDRLLVPGGVGSGVSGGVVGGGSTMAVSLTPPSTDAAVVVTVVVVVVVVTSTATKSEMVEPESLTTPSGRILPNSLYHAQYPHHAAVSHSTQNNSQQE